MLRAWARKVSRDAHPAGLAGRDQAAEAGPPPRALLGEHPGQEDLGGFVLPGHPRLEPRGNVDGDADAGRGVQVGEARQEGVEEPELLLREERRTEIRLFPDGGGGKGCDR
jgi:hypothetical protein